MNAAPPPPQSFRRKDKNKERRKNDAALSCDQGGEADFRAAQRRYTYSQIVQSEGLSHPGQVPTNEAESLLLLDIILNSPMDTMISK